MARHTSGGWAGRRDRFYRPADLDDLCGFLRGLPPDEPLLWLGLGSNLLVRDGGIRGTVIATQGALQRAGRWIARHPAGRGRRALRQGGALLRRA